MAGPAVRLDGVARAFGAVVAVRSLDLEVGTGSCVGLVGHNGSGKSTLLQMIAGRLRPSDGRVEVDGHDLATRGGREHARRFVAVGGATGALYPDLTVAEHLELVAVAHGVDGIDVRVDTLLDRVGLDARRNALPSQLSTGMRQKLDLALALVRPSQLLILDEPDRGLDPAARRRVWEDVEAYRAAGRTVLVATHQPIGLDDLLDEVLLLEYGEVVARGELAVVSDTPAGERLGLTTSGPDER